MPCIMTWPRFAAWAIRSSQCWVSCRCCSFASRRWSRTCFNCRCNDSCWSVSCAVVICSSSSTMFTNAWWLSNIVVGRKMRRVVQSIYHLCFLWRYWNDFDSLIVDVFMTLKTSPILWMVEQFCGTVRPWAYIESWSKEMHRYWRAVDNDWI